MRPQVKTMVKIIQIWISYNLLKKSFSVFDCKFINNNNVILPGFHSMLSMPGFGIMVSSNL